MVEGQGSGLFTLSGYYEQKAIVMYLCQYLKLKYTLHKMTVSSKLLSQNDYHKNIWHTPRIWNSIKESFIEQ